MKMRLDRPIALLLVLLLVSATVSVLLYSDNARLDQDGSSASTRLQMNEVLSKAQMAVQGQIKKVDALVSNVSMNISTLGLNGTQVRAKLIAALESNAYILDIITYDINGMVMAAEPEACRSLEGTNLSAQETVVKLLTTKMPVMSEVFSSTEGETGAVFAAPVFDADGQFIGAVSALFSASALMNGTLPHLLEGTEFAFFCAQLDGTDIYDTDTAQIGMNLITDYVDYPEVQDIGRRLVNESTGHGTYSYLISLGDDTVVDKECYWTTVGSHGITWRLIIIHQV
ncbi:MAG: cache domain-containing protein [Methanomassiliicoccales archaeon]|nr:cache domain-containing protein [Methanomassiliicoccales archaeon]